MSLRAQRLIPILFFCKGTNNFPFLQTFLRLFAIIWLLSAPSNHPTRHMSHGFREDYPKISSKTIKFAPPMWVRYDSVVTPLFCRQRLCIQQMYSTLTVNRQNGQKQIGQIHLFNLLLPNLPIDFIPLPMTLGIAAQTECRAELARAMLRWSQPSMKSMKIRNSAKNLEISDFLYNFAAEEQLKR